jgi:hypothetical protein
MPIISSLAAKKIFYEDVVAYYLRYPEIMFMADSPGFPLNPDDMDDAYQFAMAQPRPNMTRGNDVGWQNFVTDLQYIPKVNLGEIQTKGPILYKELFAHLKQWRLQEQNDDYGNRPPFIRINIKNAIMRGAYKMHLSGELDVIEPFITVPGYLPIGTLVFSKYTEDVKKYFNGPSPSFDTPYYQHTKLSPDFKKFPYMLFARSDICTTVPCKQLGLLQMFEADFSKTTTDINLMYTNLGLSAKNEPKVVVLKCFLYAYMSARKNTSELHTYVEYLATNIYKLTSENVANDISLIAKPIYNFEIIQKVDSVLNNLGDILTAAFEKTRVFQYNIDSITKKYHNPVFQGFYQASGFDQFSYDGFGATRIDNFTRYAMHEICQLQNMEIPKYPKICACVGRGTDVADTRIAVKNTLYKPVCHDSDCLAGQSSREVYHLAPQLPCAKLTVCKTNINLGFTRKLEIDGMDVNCNFAVQYDPPLTPATAYLHGNVKTWGLAVGMGILILLLLFLFCRR